MTITTIEDLRALPDGDSICVGTTMQEWQASTWTKDGDVFRLSGDAVVQITPEAFVHDLAQNRVVRAEGILPSPGQLRTAGGRTYIVLDQATPAEGGGWWFARVTRAGLFRELIQRAEPPGEQDRAETPAWLESAYSVCTEVLNLRRQVTAAEAGRGEAVSRQQAAEARLAEARADALREVAPALEGLGEHVPQDSPIWTRLSGLGVTGIRGPVTMTCFVQGTTYVDLSSEQMREMIPEGAVPSGSSGRVAVTWEREVPVLTTGTYGECVCRNRTSSVLRDAAADAGLPDDWGLVDTYCPWGWHNRMPSGAEQTTAPPAVGQEFTNREQFEALPVGSEIIPVRHGRVTANRYRKLSEGSEQRYNWAITSRPRTPAYNDASFSYGQNWRLASLGEPEVATSKPETAKDYSVGMALNTEELMNNVPMGAVVVNERGTEWTRIEEGRNGEAVFSMNTRPNHRLALSAFLHENWQVASLPEGYGEAERDPNSDPRVGDWFTWGTENQWFRLSSIEDDMLVADGRVTISRLDRGIELFDWRYGRYDYTYRWFRPDSEDLHDGVKQAIEADLS